MKGYHKESHCWISLENPAWCETRSPMFLCTKKPVTLSESMTDRRGERHRFNPQPTTGCCCGTTRLCFG